MSKLIKEVRPYKGGTPRTKWVREEGAIPPSQENTHRRSLYEKIRLKALYAIGTSCVQCGFRDVRALHIDHINGGGSKEHKKYSGTSYYYHILKNPDPKKYQVLCANCNYIKRIENQECKRKG